ncbi:Uncharacterised protein [Vibrio cholerae]|nr:Uncharacterised protein [Vibrio cholerae]
MCPLADYLQSTAQSPWLKRELTYLDDCAESAIFLLMG